MINNCENNKMKYSFYDVDSNTLYDSNYHETHDIYKIANKPLLNIKDNSINYAKRKDIKDYNPMNELTSGQISTIIDLLKTERKDYTIFSIQYVRQNSNISHDDNYVSIINYKDALVIFYFANNYLISKIITSNLKIENNDYNFSNSFDIFKILK